MLANRAGGVPLPAGVARTHAAVEAALRRDFARFEARAEQPVAGCFLRAAGDPDLDATYDAVQALVEAVDERRRAPHYEYGVAATPGDSCGFLGGGGVDCFSVGGSNEI